eukprot:scaffold52297_cov63-Phaeocystis_antarctica.AAC.5
MLCCMRGAARDALTTDAEQRRVARARACLAARASRGLVPVRTAHDAGRSSDELDVVATSLYSCATLAVSGGAFLDASWGQQPRPVVSGGARPDVSWDLAAVAAGVATTALNLSFSGVPPSPPQSPPSPHSRALSCLTSAARGLTRAIPSRLVKSAW